MSDSERLAFYRQQRDKALEAIADIESRGRKLYDPGEPDTEVTAPRLAYLRQRAKLYDGLMSLWQKNQAEKPEG